MYLLEILRSFGEDVYIAENVVIKHPRVVMIGSPARKLKDRPKEKMIEYARRLGHE